MNTLFSSLCFASMMMLFYGCDKCESNSLGVCTCTEEYAPVCGCDNVTYDNKCFAECQVDSWETGACR